MSEELPFLTRTTVDFLLDEIIASRGRVPPAQPDLNRLHRIVLPFAAGTLCIKALEQLGSCHLGHSGRIHPTTFHRSKAALQAAGFGLTFRHASKIPGDWTAIGKWRDTFDSLRDARLRRYAVVPCQFRLNGVNVQSKRLSAKHITALMVRSSHISAEVLEAWNSEASAAQLLANQNKLKNQHATPSQDLQMNESAHNLIALRIKA